MQFIGNVKSNKGNIYCLRYVLNKVIYSALLIYKFGMKIRVDGGGVIIHPRYISWGRLYRGGVGGGENGFDRVGGMIVFGPGRNMVRSVYISLIFLAILVLSIVLTSNICR